ncbi:prepilin peptidase [Roseburia hominis]
MRQIELLTAVILGICIFSFLSRIIYRLVFHIDFTKRMRCPVCGQKLSITDMIPVLSFLIHRGKCRYCKAKISRKSILIELLGGAIGFLCVFVFGWSLRALAAFVFFAVLTVVAFVDMETKEIPNGLVVIAEVVGALSILFFPEIPILDRGIGIVCVSVPMLAFTCAVPGTFGGGDIKLMAACGVFLGWKYSLLAIVLALALAGIYCGILLVIRKGGRKTQISFGAFICLGILVAFLWGEWILKWYFGIFGL